MGYNLKNAKNGKSASKIPNVAKFEPPVMKEQVYTTV